MPNSTAKDKAIYVGINVKEFTHDVIIPTDRSAIISGPVTIPNVTVNGNLNVIGDLTVTNDTVITGNLNITG